MKFVVSLCISGQNTIYVIYLISNTVLKTNLVLFKLKRNGGEDTEEYTDLQRRIRLLYIERTEMLEVIQILESYQKRRNANA